MEITKEVLTARLETAKAELEQKVGELNQLNGVIQDCNYWLGIMEQEENKPSSNSEPTLKKVK